MFLRNVANVLVALATLLGTGCVSWGVERGFQPVSGAELAMKSEPLAPGAPAIILFHQVDRDDMRGMHEYDYYRIKILTEEGRKFADVEIPFVDSSYHITNLNARTIRPDGSIVNFQGKAFEKTVVKARGLKYLAKTFTLPDVQVGGIIEYYYEVVSDNSNMVYDSHWVISDELFTKRAQFSLKPYEGTLGLRWVWQRMPPDAKPVEGKDHIVRLEVSNIPAMPVEDYMPPKREMETRVDFIYHEEHDETEPEKFWKQKGRKLNEELESFIGKRDAMQQAVSQIVSPSDSAEVKLQKIYARVQQFRNTSYELEKTKEEEKRDKEKNANNVADLWKHGYGSGEQLTWLFVALARAAGFESYGAWMGSRDRYFFQANSMDVWNLNANIAVVVVNGQNRFFDPGCKFAPFGILPWEETGISALRMDKDGGTWIKVPVQPSSASRVERTASLKITDTGDVEGTLTVKYTGLEALERRQEERHDDDVERKKFLEEEVESVVPAGIEVQLTSHPAWDSSVDPLEADFHLKVPGWISGTGRRALLPVGIFSAQDKHVFEHTNRVHPIYMKYLFQRIDDVTVELPEGWKAEDLPKKQDSGGNVIVYQIEFDGGGNKLHMRRKLEVDFLMLDTKYYAGLRNFYQALGSSDDAQIVLQTATTAASK